MKEPWKDRIGDFMAGKGFYIVLFLCVAAIGISGYYLFSSLSPDKDPGTAVAGPAQVTVTPTPALALAPKTGSEHPAFSAVHGQTQRHTGTHPDTCALCRAERDGDIHRLCLAGGGGDHPPVQCGDPGL